MRPGFSHLSDCPVPAVRYPAPWVWVMVALQLLLGGCGGSGSGGSGSGGSSSGSASATTVSGAVADAFVLNGTVTAYTVSSAGVVGACVPAASGSGCATAQTTAAGAYTISLGTYSGPVLLQSTGGSYDDTVTGQTVSVPSALVLSVFLPAVTPGPTTIVAQIDGLTTIAAQQALARMAQGTTAATAASDANASVQTAFGGSANIVSTALVDLTQASCGTAGTAQASFDVSLVLAGIAQLASQSKVTSAALTAALIEDISDGTVDGLLDSSTAISVPLAAGGGSVALATIEGSNFGVSLENAIKAFQASLTDACKATQSATQAAALPAYTPPAPEYQYSINYTVSGYAGTAAMELNFFVDLSCMNDVVVGAHTVQSAPYISGNGSYTASGGGSPNGYATIDYNNCGTNSWTFAVKSSPGQVCSVAPSSGTFTSTDSGNLNLAAPNPVLVSCSPLYSIGGTLRGLAAGGLVLQDNDGDNLAVAANSTAFTFATALAAGAGYAVTIATQPTGETCVLPGNAAGTVGAANVTVAISCTSNGGGLSGGGTSVGTKVYVVDSTHTLFEFDDQGNELASVPLPGAAASVGNLNGGGITADAINVYVTLGSPAPGVAAFNRSTLAPVTLPGGSFANLSTPRAITYDPLNSQFYIANGGSTVTAYDAAGNYLTSLPSSGALYGPSGIAYDPTDDALWVANYTGGTASSSPSYGVAEFAPNGTLIANFPTADTNAPTQFAPPANSGHELPYAIGFCPTTGTTPATSVVVGFISDTTSQGISELGAYGTNGVIFASTFPGLTNIHAVACDPDGNVFVGADSGLTEFGAAGGVLGPTTGTFTGLTKPIYGVAVIRGGLASPQGLLYAGGLLYVANSGTNQVLIYSIQTNATSGLVTGMTQASAISADLNDPVRLAIDAAGHLFVANLGSNTVTVYDTKNGNREITASGGGALISGAGINRPLGVAVDSSGRVYVGNNAGNSIAIYNPVSSGNVSDGYTPVAGSPLTADAAGNYFTAPGALYDAGILGGDYLLIGLGSTTGANQVLVYATPLTMTSRPVFNLSSAACASFPTGPTGIGAYVSSAQPTSSIIYITSYYTAPTGAVNAYSATELLSSQSNCPQPVITTASSLISRPEGVAVDTAGVNVFVANSGDSTITVYNGATGLASAPIYTLHN